MNQRRAASTTKNVVPAARLPLASVSEESVSGSKAEAKSPSPVASVEQPVDFQPRLTINERSQCRVNGAAPMPVSLPCRIIFIALTLFAANAQAGELSTIKQAVAMSDLPRYEKLPLLNPHRKSFTRAYQKSPERRNG